mgnify:CR=1 FL=1
MQRNTEDVAAVMDRAVSDFLAGRIRESVDGLDRVAAIRFASVYRNFEDLAEFEAELRRSRRSPQCRR